MPHAHWPAITRPGERGCDELGGAAHIVLFSLSTTKERASAKVRSKSRRDTVRYSLPIRDALRYSVPISDAVRYSLPSGDIKLCSLSSNDVL